MLIGIALMSMKISTLVMSSGVIIEVLFSLSPLNLKNLILL